MLEKYMPVFLRFARNLFALALLNASGFFGTTSKYLESPISVKRLSGAPFDAIEVFFGVGVALFGYDFSVAFWSRFLGADDTCYLLVVYATLGLLATLSSLLELLLEDDDDDAL